MLERAEEKTRIILPLLLLTLALTAFYTRPFSAHDLVSPTFQFSPSGIGWITEPLQQVFNQIQNRIIGLIPGNYTEPTSSDYSTMNRVFTLINSGIAQNNSGSILDASALASEENYQLIPLNDSVTGNKFFVLMENVNVNRGWGSYMFAAEKSPSATRIILEAPHPVTDFNSQEIAFSIYAGTYPRVTALLVSGVERTFGLAGQTDMAHRSQSIFETAHESLTSFGSVVIQIHGFSAFAHPQEPLVVLSNGDGGLNGALQSIATNLSDASISVGIFDGFTHEKLGAQGNVQGRYARAFGAGFVHTEISSLVVFNATLITQFENSVGQSIISNFRFPAYQLDIKIPAIALGIMCLFFFASFRFSRTKVKI